MQKILVIDDDKDLCFLLHQFLSRNAYLATLINTGEEALSYLEGSKPDLILCDLRLGDIDGITLLGKVKDIYADVPVIMITAFHDIGASTQALKQGAYDYVMKPLISEQILATIQEALETRNKSEAQPKRNKTNPEGEENDFFWPAGIVSSRLQKQVKLVAPTNYHVIIYGEAGVGKRSLAEEIHRSSKRANAPFILIEGGKFAGDDAAELLFGSESDADGNIGTVSKGLLENANGGSLCIDDPEKLPLTIQETLLKFLQRKKMKRLNGTNELPLDVRVFITANDLLWNATRNGKFKEGLYHLVNDFHILIPALRERKEEIPVYAEHFLHLYHKTGIGKLSTEVQTELKNYAWPGNLHELKEVMKKTMLSGTGELAVEDLEEYIKG